MALSRLTRFLIYPTIFIKLNSNSVKSSSLKITYDTYVRHRSFLIDEVKKRYRQRLSKRNLVLSVFSVLSITGLSTAFVCTFTVFNDCSSSSKSFGFLPNVSAAQVFDPGLGSSEIEGGGGGSKSKRYNFIADVVEKAAPAVVYIEIQGRHPFTGAGVTVSNGSGFIVEEDGMILTNAHVVANRSSVLVRLHDGRVFNGTVGEVDAVSDLAVIRIPCTNLPTLKLGTSKNLRPGEWVVAMGSPLSLSNTITAGVISSVHRESKELGLHHKNMEYIQTDASITDGEVIGINSMKVTAGISFAIPADYAKEFLKSSSEKAKRKTKGWFGGGSSQDDVTSRRRYMGITMLTLTPSIILELQQRQADFPPDVTHGVLIWKVVVGSPAYNGGLQPGDVVVSINDAIVKSSSDVYNALSSPQELRMVILRRRQKLSLTVVPQNVD